MRMGLVGGEVGGGVYDQEISARGSGGKGLYNLLYENNASSCARSGPISTFNHNNTGLSSQMYVVLRKKPFGRSCEL